MRATTTSERGLCSARQACAPPSLTSSYASRRTSSRDHRGARFQTQLLTCERPAGGAIRKMSTSSASPHRMPSSACRRSQRPMRMADGLQYINVIESKMASASARTQICEKARTKSKFSSVQSSCCRTARALFFSRATRAPAHKKKEAALMCHQPRGLQPQK